jgi:hypothetical protein
MQREVNALSEARRRQASPVDSGMSEAPVDSRKQDGSHNINCVVSDTATESFMLASRSDSKGSLEALRNNATLSASVTSFTFSAAATSSTLQATTTSSRVPAAFTLSVFNCHNEDHSEAKENTSVAKIGSIKLETKQSKRRYIQVFVMLRRIT